MWHRLLFVLLVIQIQIAFAQTCDGEFKNFLPSVPLQQKFFSNGKAFKYIENPQAHLSGKEYEEFLDNSIEVLFEPSEPFGHIRFRAGKKQYSFNYIMSTSMGPYTPRIGEGRMGYAFIVDGQLLKELDKEMENFYKFSSHHNFPPFDAYSPPLKIVKDGKNWRYKSPSKEYSNNEMIDGDIIFENGSYFVENSGYKFPVKKIGHETFEIQSYSCISSAAFWAKRFGVNLNPWVAAKDLNEMLKNPSGKLSSPHYIFKYW
jgi:hypothetical protein